MKSKPRPDPDEVAFRRMKPSIDQGYPQGHFVAIEDGQILGDAITFDELDGILSCLGKRSKEILVVQAGVDYPEYVDFLFEA